MIDTTAIQKAGQKNIAYISAGRLFYMDLTTGQRREIQCEFGEKIKERVSRTLQTREWKLQSNQQTLVSSGYSLWNESGIPNPTTGLRAYISGASFAPKEHSLFFSFDGDEVNGLFAVDVHDLQEHRLFHLPNTIIRNPSTSPSSRRIVYSQYNDEGHDEHLFLYDKDTGRKQQLTEGDSIDTAPSWSADESRILYQSAGIGRTTTGFDVAIGSFSLYELDTEKGRVRHLCEQPGRDLHSPRWSPEGNKILCISKPTDNKSSVSSFRLLLQLLTAPFRLMAALFEFVNSFVARYTGKPLLETSLFKRRMDLQQSLLLGHPSSLQDYDVLMDEFEEERQAVKAPRTWELVEYDPEQERFKTLIKGVSSFDLSSSDGSILYSNGREIFSAKADGSQAVQVCSSAFVKNVLWC